MRDTAMYDKYSHKNVLIYDLWFTNDTHHNKITFTTSQQNYFYFQFI